MPTTETTPGPPDVVGVGAQRSGTTWWFRLLLEHPGIKLSARRRNELHFFNKFCARRMQDEDVALYHELFPRQLGAISGEWTPRYMYDPWTPRLLRRAAPEAKILVHLRDPVERHRSGVTHQLQFTPKLGAAAIAVAAVNCGRYASQVKGLWSCFDRDQLLILQYERCRDDPLTEYARTLRFLEVDDALEPEGVRTPRGRSTQPQKEPLWPELCEDLQVALEADVRDVKALVPELDLSLWPHIADLTTPSAAPQPSS